MHKFDLHILGCGSALPTTKHFASAQVVNVREKLFMIDCGEGTQIQLRRTRLKITRLNHIFISHLHGDHCFGLIGLISTLGMLGRTAELHIYAPAGLEEMLAPQIAYFCQGITYKVVFHTIDTWGVHCIYEDKSVRVHTIPLKHRMPCCGFLFEEIATPNHIRREMIERYHIPVCYINRIKNGADYVCDDGTVVANSQLTTPADPPRRYAYCSDTIYNPRIVAQIKGVDLLYHEATFAQSELPRARETFHTTAQQAGEIARAAEVRQLVIGHFSARYDDEAVLLSEAKGQFDNTILAHEGLKIEIPIKPFAQRDV